MDPLSQAALGAVAGQAVGHARLGYRAAAVGALAGALPDVDVLFAIGGDYFDELVVHRGITHSLFFGPVVGPLLGAAVYAWEKHRAGTTPLPGAADGRRAAWMMVVSVALLSHPLLDLLTTYGTQLLMPFSHRRFAINAMPIIDPVYTLLLGLGLLVAATRGRPRAAAVAVTTLLVSSAYLGYGWWLNVGAEHEARRQLAEAGVEDARIAAFPTILQVHYRRVVARTGTVDRVGFISMWRPCRIDWSAAPRTDRTSAPVQAFLDSREGRIFDWFTMGWGRYRVTGSAADKVVHATDLRYGFTADPDRSIFNATASVGPYGNLVGAVRPGRDTADASGQLALLFQDTYTPTCSLAGAAAVTASPETARPASERRSESPAARRNPGSQAAAR